MSSPATDSTRYARWFRASTPYIRKHRGRTFVVMLGGDAIEHANLVNIVHDLALLSVLGVRIVLVHGARPQIERALSDAHIDNTYVAHRRVTDARAMAVIAATVGGVRSALEGWFSTGIPNSPLHGTHIRVLSGNLVTARPIGIVDGTNLGFTGRARRIDGAAITDLLDSEAIVLLSPTGHSPSGAMFNLSAEELAADVAAHIKADKLIILDRENRLGSPGTELTPSQAQASLDDLNPTTRLRGTELIRAVRAGVRRAHLVAFSDDGALLEELFTARGTGTQISEQEFSDIRQATLDDVAGIAELIRPLEDDGALVRRSREHLEQDIEQFLVAEIDGIIVGCCALFPDDAGMAELACVATHPGYRRTRADESSLGDRLLARVEATARESNINVLYALTTQARDWFSERGFVDAETTDLPEQRGYNLQRGSHIVVKTLV